MNEPTQPLPATIAAALRYLIAILLPLAVHAGWIDAGTTVDAVLGIALPIATVLYGLWRTHQRQATIVNSATIPARAARPPA